jgi:hypothetical protein
LQGALNAQGKIVPFKWLEDQAIHACFCTKHMVVCIAAGSQTQDGYFVAGRWPLPDGLGHSQAIHVGHEHVEQDHVHIIMFLDELKR